MKVKKFCHLRGSSTNRPDDATRIVVFGAVKKGHDYEKDAVALHETLIGCLPNRTVDLLLRQLLIDYPTVNPVVSEAIGVIVDEIDNPESIDVKG